MGTLPARGPQPRTILTPGDRRVLEMLAAHRVAVVPQVARLLAVSEGAAATRLLGLGGRGLVEVRGIFRGQPRSTWITARGLRAVGAGPARLGPELDNHRHYRHEIGVVWLWLAARQGAFGPPSRLLAEREMRAHDQRADRSDAPLGVGVGSFDWRGRPTRHYPDLLLRTNAGERLAIELELTRKSDGRLARIMRGYAGDARVDRVIYVAEGASLARAVRAGASRAGIAALVSVHQLSSRGVPGAPLPIGRTPAVGRGIGGLER